MNELGSAFAAFQKARGVGHRLPQCEAVILGSLSGGLMGRYAEEVIKARWPEAERLLWRHGQIHELIQYCEYAHKERWPRVEKEILRNGHAIDIIAYSLNVVGGRWPEAERKLLGERVGHWLISYAKQVINGRWPEAEAIIVETLFEEQYAKEVLPGNWGEQVAQKCPCWLYYYAKDVIGGMLPEELHNRMLAEGVRNPSDSWVTKYLGCKKYRRPRKPR